MTGVDNCAVAAPEKTHQARGHDHDDELCIRFNSWLCILAGQKQQQVNRLTIAQYMIDGNSSSPGGDIDTDTDCCPFQGPRGVREQNPICCRKL